MPRDVPPSRSDVPVVPVGTTGTPDATGIEAKLRMLDDPDARAQDMADRPTAPSAAPAMSSLERKLALLDRTATDPSGLRDKTDDPTAPADRPETAVEEKPPGPDAPATEPPVPPRHATGETDTAPSPNSRPEQEPETRPDDEPVRSPLEPQVPSSEASDSTTSWSDKAIDARDPSAQSPHNIPSADKLPHFPATDEKSVSEASRPADQSVAPDAEATDTAPQVTTMSQADFWANHPKEYIPPSDSAARPDVSRPFQHPETWLQRINPEPDRPGRDNNCGDCARATELTWRGVPAVSAAYGYPDAGGETDDRMEEWSRGDLEPASFADIQGRLEKNGSGASAVVAVGWGCVFLGGVLIRIILVTRPWW